MNSNPFNLSDAQRAMARKMGLSEEAYFRGICLGATTGSAEETKRKHARGFKHSHLVGNEREKLAAIYGDDDDGK